MNVEAYNYVIITALLGMGIVFFFLVVLSVLMIVIRALFDTPPAGAAKKSRDAVPAVDSAGGAEVERSGGADVVDAFGVPRWAIAAALAYLTAEEKDHTPYATVWTERGDR